VTGDSSTTANDQQTPQGIDSKHFQDRQADQKVGPSSETSAFPAADSLHKAMYGQENGKGK